MFEPGRSHETTAVLDEDLRALGREIEFPQTPDLVASVRRRLGETHAPHGWWNMAPARQPLVAAALIGIAFVVALLALVPDVRTSFAHWFSIPGIRLVIVDDDSADFLSDNSLGGTLLLGERLTLSEAQAQVSYILQVPTSPDVGTPDEVYLRSVTGGKMVTLLYDAKEGLPAAAETGVGALFMQFPNAGSIDALAKFVPSHITLEWPLVGGNQGLWLEGSSFLMIDPGASLGFADKGFRHSANVLFWQESGVTFRLETALSLADAVRLAESLTPLPNTD
ncbi:MAG: hypothetical protein M3R06_00150 [Chloroflexota bacterium]|nr:hypothetical protein [Chloroflexota bacterium]